MLKPLEIGGVGGGTSLWHVHIIPIYDISIEYIYELFSIFRARGIFISPQTFYYTFM